MECKYCIEIEKNNNERLKEGFNAFCDSEYEKAMKCMLPLAEEGYVIAQCMVGGLYGIGLGVEQNSDKAKEWSEKAGQQGCGLSYKNLANMFLLDGKSADLAKHYYRKAIENGFTMIPDSWVAD